MLGQRRFILISVVVAIAALQTTASAADLAERCEALNLLNLEQVGDAPGRIVTTSLVIGKKATEREQLYFKKRGHSQGMPTPMSETFPDHCLVEGYVTPHVRFNMVLPPPEKWNYRFMLAACDAWCGKLHPEIVVPGLNRGYATLTNDGGHYSRAPFDGIWAHQNIPARIDFAYRANHVTAQVGKAIAAAYYGSAPKYSYIAGFSKGGNAGLFAAEKYPQDFDGVFSKAPVPYYQWKNAAHFPWQALAVYPDGKNPVMYSDKLPLIEKAVLAACDKIDGLVDGIIDDPRKCKFDPGVLTCKRGQAEDQCLTSAQVDSLRKIYAKPTDASGQTYYDFPTDFGSESDWARAIYPERGSVEPTFSLTGAMTGLRYMVFENNPGPGYDWMKFDYVKEKPNLAAMSKIRDPDSVDLRAFKARGGKLIIVHGWSDAMVSATMSIDWFEKMQSFMGGKKATAEFAQLYAVPSLYHGSGGRGPYVFDTQTLLEKWVEQGVQPEHIVLEDEPGVEPFRTRPSYPYPAIAQYKGKGDPNVASSFKRVEQESR
jgi:hypothetical protein